MIALTYTRLFLWIPLSLCLVLGSMGILFPHTFHELTLRPRQVLGIAPIVYPYYFIYEEKSGRHLMTVSIVVTVGDELITEEDQLYRIVRMEENKAYARYVREFALPSLSP
ncbi:MAG: hypothetical protein J6B02_00150 [Selenomonadales bacterium]|nr:hypothetical protein [Selenomonadales bacterium]